MATDKPGTIRSREAKDVVRDLLIERRVSKAIYKIAPCGDLHMLVGGRQVKFECRSGMTYYGLQALLANISRVIDEIGIERDRRQIDIEDAIASAPA